MSSRLFTVALPPELEAQVHRFLEENPHVSRSALLREAIAAGLPYVDRGALNDETRQARKARATPLEKIGAEIERQRNELERLHNNLAARQERAAGRALQIGFGEIAQLTLTDARKIGATKSRIIHVRKQIEALERMAQRDGGQDA